MVQEAVQNGRRAGDGAGNMTVIPQPGDLDDDYALEYDAWNRLVKVEDGENMLETFCRLAGRTRLLFVGIALVLRNVWVWLHFKLAKGKWDNEPQLFLELLRFQEMLLWVAQVVEKRLGADQQKGIEYEAYQRLTAIK